MAITEGGRCAIAREIKDRSSEESALGNLAVAYYLKRDYKQVIDYQKQSLSIALALKDRLGIGVILNNLGLMDLYSQNPKAAEVNLRSAITLWESIRADLKNNDAFKVSLFDTQALSYQLLQQALIAQNQTNKALEIAEQGRARALAELLIQRQMLTNSATTPNIERIRQIARQQNATLVEYSISSNDLYIWVVKPNGEVRFHQTDLKKINLGKLAENTRVTAGTIAQGRGDDVMTTLVSSTRAVLDPNAEIPSKVSASGCESNVCLHLMYNLLIKPIAIDLPTNPDSLIIFIPHESLFLVPFSALQNAENKAGLSSS